MEINEFIEKFAEVVEVEDASALNADTKFRDLNVELTVAEFRQAVTVGDLYNMLKK